MNTFPNKQNVHRPAAENQACLDSSGDTAGRWLRATREICKSCGHDNPIGFTVTDDMWVAAVPTHLRESIVCISCFIRMADNRLVPWDTDIRLYPVSLVSHFERRAEELQ